MANLSAARWGASATIVNAFLFVGLDLTSRDKLHDAWHGRGMAWKMGLLIAAGSVLSYLLNRQAGAIALASFLAFAAASIADTVVYSVLRERTWMVRVNGSNIVSAAVDSIVFPTVAFGAFLPLIVLAQFSAKVLGGWAWSLIVKK